MAEVITPIDPFALDITKTGLTTIAFGVLYKQGDLSMDIIQMVCEKVNNAPTLPHHTHKTLSQERLWSIGRMRKTAEWIDPMGQQLYVRPCRFMTNKYSCRWTIPDKHFQTKKVGGELVKSERAVRKFEWKQGWIADHHTDYPVIVNTQCISNRHREEGRKRICKNYEPSAIKLVGMDGRISFGETYDKRFPVGKPIFSL
jgi:hypothetical protein